MIKSIDAADLPYVDDDMLDLIAHGYVTLTTSKNSIPYIWPPGIDRPNADTPLDNDV